MTSRSMSEGQFNRRSISRWLLGWLPMLGLVWGWVMVGGPIPEAIAADAGQQSVLQAVDISPLAGNRLQIRFRLSEAPSQAPSSFTINDPARIVLDFLGTRNGLSVRQQNINVGVADKVSVLEGADRTRASLNLARLVPYNIQVQGNSVLLTLDNAGATTTKTPAATPATSVAAAVPPKPVPPPQRRVAAPVTVPRNIGDVSFRRGPAGQAVITARLSNPGIPVDVRQEGNQIVADFQGATLPRGQQRRLDVSDFATPVTAVEAINRGNSARLNIQPNPPFEYLAYQANELYVIEVRPPQKNTEQEEKEAMLDPSKKKYKGDLLSLNFQDIEVRAILQILADFTGLNIVVSDSVKGNLTLRLQNVPWDQALDIILRTKGLAMRQNGNVIFIAPNEEVAAREKLDLESHKVVQELIPLRTEIIQVNYAKAKDLEGLLKQGRGAAEKEKGHSVLSDRGDVVADERTNSLIVKDIPDKLAEVRDLVTKLDVPVRQVMIDSRMVIANDSFIKDIGVRFGVSGSARPGGGDSGVGISGSLDGANTISGSSPRSRFTDNAGAIPALGQRLGVNFAAAGAPSLAFSILSSHYLVDLELSALQTEGKGEIISNPRVVTADRKEATISQGQKVRTVFRGADKDANLVTDALLKLQVTPQITPDDRITMDLTVTKDDIASSTDTQTITDNREVKTQVLVNNGETVVLGGVFEQTKNKGKSQVPLLGDIPLLGYLFQRNSNNTTKRELLIFVTPQILQNGSVAER